MRSSSVGDQKLWTSVFETTAKFFGIEWWPNGPFHCRIDGIPNRSDVLNGCQVLLAILAKLPLELLVEERSASVSSDSLAPESERACTCDHSAASTGDSATTRFCL